MSYSKSLAEEHIQIKVAVSSYASVLALYTYDYLLNLSREVELMWPGPFCHVATVLYFMTRYLPFVKLIYDIVTVYISAEPTPSRACDVALHVVDAFHILSRTSITLVLFAQTYAVYNQSWIILVTIGPLGLALIVTDGLESAARTCSLEDTTDRALHTMLSLAMLTAFPTAVMVLTFYRVLVIMRKNSNFRQCMAKKTSLTGLIMFETLCMCGVCFVRLINALWFLLAPITFNLGVNPFALPIAAIVISHFLLSLRDVNGRPGVDPTTSNHLAFTSCPFDSPANFCVDHDGDSNTCAERDREIEEEKSDGDETDEEDETLEREFPEQTIDWVGDPGRSVV